MAYAVSVGHGYSKFTARFPTAAEAICEARNQVEHDARDVRIVFTATGQEYTIAEFEALQTGRPAPSSGAETL